MTILKNCVVFLPVESDLSVPFFDLSQCFFCISEIKPITHVCVFADEKNRDKRTVQMIMCTPNTVPVGKDIDAQLVRVVFHLTFDDSSDQTGIRRKVDGVKQPICFVC